jgi:hypothetical protein
MIDVVDGNRDGDRVFLVHGVPHEPDGNMLKPTPEFTHHDGEEGVVNTACGRRDEEDRAWQSGIDSDLDRSGPFSGIPEQRPARFRWRKILRVDP